MRGLLTGHIWTPEFGVALMLGLWGCGGEAVPPAPQPTETQAPAGTSEVVGRISRAPGSALPIVMLEPRAAIEVPVSTEPVEMDQYGRAFYPSLLVVREGQVVRFKNSEDELHNVNVHDEAGVTIFNVGMPILGGVYDHTFDRAGDYQVACNVHQEMSALIVVTTTPYATIADREGRFRLSGVPHGTYDLVVRQGGSHETRVVEVSGERTEVSVDESEGRRAVS